MITTDAQNEIRLVWMEPCEGCGRLLRFYPCGGQPIAACYDCTDEGVYMDAAARMPPDFYKRWVAQWPAET